MFLKKIIKFIIFLSIIAAITKLLMFPNNNVGYSPLQPIAYDHSVHVGKSEIACQYCHGGVEKTKEATLPSLNICMNCHKSVLADRPLIKQLAKAYKNNKAIAWVRVHDLPDHVRFNHKRHTAKGINCTSCHGNIYKQKQVKKVDRLNMSTCVSCHLDPHSKMKAANKYDKVSLEAKSNLNLKAAINCSTCHY